MILSIQYLRALAAVLVLLSHAAWKGTQHAGDPMGWFRIGACGVDVFFVISGYVMCHTTRHKHGSVHEVMRFMGHRIGRIIPLYWALSLFALAAYLLAPSMVNSGGARTDILKSFLLIPTDGSYLIQAGWTLSYEFFFYALFGMGLLLPRLSGHVLTCLALMALFLWGRVLEAGPGLGGPLTAFATDAILVNFIFGIALYHLDVRKTLPMWGVAPVILLSIAWFVAVNQGWVQFHYRCVRYGVPAFLLCWGLTRLEAYLQARPSRWLSYLGDASYSVYLVHPFALALTALLARKAGLTDSPALFILVIVAVAIAAGCLCYEWLERPLTRWVRPRLDVLLSRPSPPLAPPRS